MKALSGRLKREFETLQCMTDMYCAEHHGPFHGARCGDCEELMHYAARRLEKCPYGPEKPTCARCPIHCYKIRPREQVREIMRFAGPRMTLRHPLRALTHIFDKLRPAEHPMAIRRRLRATSSAKDRPSAPGR